MKKLLVLMLALASAAPVALLAADQAKNSHGTATAGSAAPDAAWLAKAKAGYPLTTCVVSDEKLGDMGDAVDHVYHEEGKPDRLVRFCCKHCIKDFKKDPAKFLKKIDEAAKTGKS